VPSHVQRVAERKYNPAQLLARRLSLLCGLPCVNALYKSEHTERQTLLDRRQRMANLRGSFRPTAAGLRLVPGRCVLLVDDVYTTGATSHCCVQSLLSMGARCVDVAVIAYTPKNPTGSTLVLNLCHKNPDT